MLVFRRPKLHLVVDLQRIRFWRLLDRSGKITRVEPSEVVNQGALHLGINNQHPSW